MSNVIQMQGWRQRKLAATRVAAIEGKAYTYNPPSYPPIVSDILRLLSLSGQADRLAHVGETVYEREQAVLDSLRYTMQAHGLANANGYAITRTTDECNRVCYDVSAVEQKPD